MKTEKFDLQKAIDGHPLITRSGKKVEEFCYFSGIEYSICCIVEGGEEWETYTDNGLFIIGEENSMDLFLLKEDKKDKEEELVEGQKILVSKDGVNWYERIFLYKCKCCDTVLCVEKYCEESYLSGRVFNVYFWNYYKLCDDSIKIKLNGEVLNISEEKKRGICNLLGIK